jgi:hypothetical protein
MNDPAWVQAVVGIIGGIIALIAIVIATWNAYETRKASQSALLATLITEFGTQEIATALQAVRKWKEDKGEDFAVIFEQGIKADDAAAKYVNSQRRVVEKFYRKATTLHFAGAFPRKLLSYAVYNAGLNLFYDVVHKLNEKLNPRHDPDVHDYLMRHFGRYKRAESVLMVNPTAK